MGTDPVELPRFAAVILTGGTAVRLDGTDKAALEMAGRTLLDRALDAVRDAVEVVVVGDRAPTTREVTFTREDPPHGGPAAGLLAGRDALTMVRPGAPRTVLVVLACDMPWVDRTTVGRLLLAAVGGDGAVLTGPDGRSQLAMALDPVRLGAVGPGVGARHGLPVHRLLAELDLARVPATGDEHRDVDTWSDVRDLPR